MRIPAPSPQLRITSAAHDLLIVLPALEAAIVPDPSRRPPQSSSSTSRTGSPARPPWSSPAASAIFTLADRAYAAECILRPPHLPVPPPRATVPAIQRSLAYAAAAAPVSSPALLPAAARLLEGALHVSLQALGSEERWSPLPRLPRTPAPRCPFSCGLPSLRMRPLQGSVRCITPHCTDSHGLPHPEASAYPRRGKEPGEWEWRLIWRDGTEGIPQRDVTTLNRITEGTAAA
jgi:hypothetical protein